MTRIKAFLASEYTGVLKRPWSRLLLSLQERLRLFIRATAAFRSPRKNCRPKMAKSAFSCGAMSFQLVSGCPSCAMKHWRVDATSSCMLRIRLFCSTKASGVSATRRSGRFCPWKSLLLSPSARTGAIAGDRAEKIWGSVWIFSGLRVKRGWAGW
ncbi:hypothetical protein HmCms148_02305 [Escherichia coli]|nr:hypothetical protein HmCms148_02305 [Escherichia coli]